MGKNQMSLKKMDAYIKTLRKQARNISASNDKIKKTVENMNANIYHGGKTANDWYHSADASCTSNVNFLKRLDNSISVLEKLYKKLKGAAAGNTEIVDVSTTATGSVIGAAAGGAALGGGTPTGNNTSSSADNNSTLDWNHYIKAYNNVVGQTEADNAKRKVNNDAQEKTYAAWLLKNYKAGDAPKTGTYLPYGKEGVLTQADINYYKDVLYGRYDRR